MKYITHHRFKGMAACGKRFNLPYGTKLELTGGFITAGGKAICFPTSENAHMHFARNDDGKGLERGALTYAIAYAQRNTGTGYRFTKEEAEMLATRWPHFLRQDSDYILFNQQFFEADVPELKALASALNIKTRR